jgi:hypothetical protein
MFYTLEFMRPDGRQWREGPIAYDNLSVTFPVGFYFCPVEMTRAEEKERMP